MFSSWLTLPSFIFWLSLVVASAGDIDASTADCSDGAPFPPPQPLAQRKKARENSVHLIGLFDVHEGSSCRLLKPGGMQQVMMTIGILENRLTSFMDSMTLEIGFDVYDTCSNVSTAVLHLIHALNEVKALTPNCSKRHYVGVLGPMNPDIQQEISGFLKSINIPYIPLRITSLKAEIEALTAVLSDLRWKTVGVFSATKSLAEEFREEADKRNICIASSVILPSRDSSDSYLRMVFHELTDSGIQVAVVIGSGINIKALYEMAVLGNSSIQYWLLAGMDTEDFFLSILFGPDHPVILFRKALTNVPRLDVNIMDLYEFGPKIKRLNLVRSYIEYINSCSKNENESLSNDSRCEDRQLRTRNPFWSIMNGSVDKLLNGVSEVGILQKETNETSMPNATATEDTSDQTEEAVEIWTYQHALGKFSKHKDSLVGHYSEGNLIWDKKRLNVFRFMGSGWFKIPEFHCRKNCHELCSNFGNISLMADLDNLYNRLFHWKHETWVTILLTISSVGIIISLLISIYLTVKSCKEDFEDGNQLSHVILLIAVIFSYSCTVMFMFYKDSATCTRRIAIVGIAYVCMLAPVISRCFLLIAAEMDGVHGHVSGFLQSVLCFFIFAVQVAMAVYYWLANVDFGGFKFKCMIDMKQTLTYLSYAMILSLIWLIASPFCIRSRRNNREGLLLHLGSIAVCVVWLVWHLLFFLLPSHWNEFTVCFGLVATATAIILILFLPKIYKMVVSAAAEQHGQVSMQPVIFASTSSRSPNLSIYESVNHGYNPDKDGFIVDVFRDEDESPGSRKMTHL